MVDLTLQLELSEAVKENSVEKVKECLRRGADAKHMESLYLQKAVRFGFVDLVKVLLPVSNPRDSDDQLALSIASERGDERCLDLLLPFACPDILRERRGFPGRTPQDFLHDELTSSPA